MTLKHSASGPDFLRLSDPDLKGEKSDPAKLNRGIQAIILNSHVLLSTITCCLSEKSCPVLYSDIKVGQKFLDIQ